MKSTPFLNCLIFLSFQAFSQDDPKWSVEANYPIATGKNYIADTKGVFDLGIKYRFTDLGIIKLGAGLNAGFFADSDNFRYGDGNNDNLINDLKAKNILVQPKILAEFNMPVLKRLKPHIGLGYSIIVSDYYQNMGGDIIFDDTSTNGGFNANLGLSYDFTSKLFIQVQYDYIGQRVDNAFTGDKVNIGINLIKAGFGFRF